MPSITPPARVLVSGANGFIAIHVVKTLVEKGYHVRGTVRTPQKGEYIARLVGTERFEYFIVPDMEVPGAFDDAVKGMDAVEHVASIIGEMKGDPDRVIQPAIQGTVGILESVKAHGQSVKRVVVTSSFQAVGREGGMTEKDWNDKAVETFRKDGINAGPHTVYAASKVLAEKAAWEFMEKNKDSIKFDLVSVLPTWVWGPMVHGGTGPASINASSHMFLSFLNQDKAPMGDMAKRQMGDVIDVRDAALVHADVLSIDAAANQRIIAGAYPVHWQNVYDALNKAPAIPNMPVGEPGTAMLGRVGASPQKLLDLLGKSHSDYFKPFEVTARDTVKSAIERGWAPRAAEAK